MSEPKTLRGATIVHNESLTMSAERVPCGDLTDMRLEVEPLEGEPGKGYMVTSQVDAKSMYVPDGYVGWIAKVVDIKQALKEI